MTFLFINHKVNTQTKSFEDLVNCLSELQIAQLISNLKSEGYLEVISKWIYIKFKGDPNNEYFKRKTVHKAWELLQQESDYDIFGWS
jgi:hypothetical protein